MAEAQAGKAKHKRKAAKELDQSMEIISGDTVDLATEEGQRRVSELLRSQGMSLLSQADVSKYQQLERQLAELRKANEVAKPPEVDRTRGQVEVTYFRHKMPSKAYVWEFITDDQQLFAPPIEEFTADFARDVLSGKKLLLPKADVIQIRSVPRYQELSAKVLWPAVRADPALARYFPDYSRKKLPNQQYLWTVLNTVDPHSISRLAAELTFKKKEQRTKQGRAVGVSSRFIRQFEAFISRKLERTEDKRSTFVHRMQIKAGQRKPPKRAEVMKLGYKFKLKPKYKPP